MTGTVLDHLQEQGYEPRDDSPGRTLWADLTASGVGTVRVVINPEDEFSVEVYAFDKYLATEWEAHLSPGTPDAVALALIEAAEWDLAAKAHRPVTPKQAEAAR